MVEQTTGTGFRLTADKAESLIHKIAGTTAKVQLTTHAKDRMMERGITIQDVYRILRSGQILDPPESAKTGDWKCKISLKLSGRRAAGVVAVIVKSERLVIVTVEWEDGR